MPEELGNLTIEEVNSLRKREKPRMKFGLATLVGLIALIELATFQYYPRSQKNLYNGKIQRAYANGYYKFRFYELKKDSVGEWLGMYQIVKLRALGAE